MVTVLSDIRVVTGAMATCTGPLPWARLVTTVWYMLTGIWTSPGETKGRWLVGIGLSFPDAAWTGQPAPALQGTAGQPHVIAHHCPSTNISLLLPTVILKTDCQERKCKETVEMGPRAGPPRLAQEMSLPASHFRKQGWSGVNAPPQPSPPDCLLPLGKAAINFL